MEDPDGRDREIFLHSLRGIGTYFVDVLKSYEISDRLLEREIAVFDKDVERHMIDTDEIFRRVLQLFDETDQEEQIVKRDEERKVFMTRTIADKLRMCEDICSFLKEKSNAGKVLQQKCRVYPETGDR
jgi:hypothetical protein